MENMGPFHGPEFLFGDPYNSFIGSIWVAVADLAFVGSMDGDNVEVGNNVVSGLELI